MSRHTARAVWVTSADGVDHLVTQVELAASVRRGDGMLRACCTALFAGASLVTSPAPCCPACVARALPLPRPREPRRGPLAVLLDRRTATPAPAGAGAPDRAPVGHHRRAS